MQGQIEKRTSSSSQSLVSRKHLHLIAPPLPDEDKAGFSFNNKNHDRKHGRKLEKPDGNLEHSGWCHAVQGPESPPSAAKQAVGGRTVPGTLVYFESSSCDSISDDPLSSQRACHIFYSNPSQFKISLPPNLFFTSRLAPRLTLISSSRHTMSPFISMRRFSRSNSVHDSKDSKTSASHQPVPPTSYTPPMSHAPMMNGSTGSQHDSRPVSSTKTSSSFDFANRPPTNYQMSALPSGAVGNLSRTDQIVLRHFWDVKYEENKSRDLHFVSFAIINFAQSDHSFI